MKIDISNLDDLDKDGLLDLQLLLHDKLSSMKFDIDVAYAEAEEEGGVIDVTWLTRIKYAQLKNREKLRKVSAQLRKANNKIKQDNITFNDLNWRVLKLVRKAEDLIIFGEDRYDVYDEISDLLRRYK